MDDLKIEVLKEGDGAVAEAGDIVSVNFVPSVSPSSTPAASSVHYTGWLTDGTKFDSSVDRGEPIEYPCGVGMVIPGWEKAVVGMKVGQKCRVTIPPHLGYGPYGAAGVIPPNATLVFEMELVDVKKQ